MRKRLTYANVAATLALVFSMTGGALAANHYLIESTKQINPKVLKKLKGANGKTGLPGATGRPGNEGPAGGALAYAHIFKGGKFDPSLSKNITAANIKRERAGFYCIGGLPFKIHNVEATIDYLGTHNGETPLITVEMPTTFCSGLTDEAGIFEGKHSSGTETEGVDDGFFLVIN